MGYDADSLEEVLKEELGTTTLMTDCRHPKYIIESFIIMIMQKTRIVCMFVFL